MSEINVVNEGFRIGEWEVLFTAEPAESGYGLDYIFLPVITSSNAE